MCGGAIAASPATLLVVVLHGLAEAVVEHKADVGFVDAHSKRYGRHYHLSGCTHNTLHGYMYVYK